MRSDVLTLVSVVRSQNAFGGWTETPIETVIPCKVESVTRAEFFDAAQVGLRPEWRFIVFEGNYSGETECEYCGKKYSIYRTYRSTGNNIELYVEAKTGVTNTTATTEGVTDA